MILDLEENEFPSDAGQYDVCIAGGGVAGITLAVTLEKHGLRILLLEAGGLEYSERSQKVYAAENIGHEYFELDSARLQFLGGTSNHWEGMCRSLDASDFQRHDHIEGSGWPIGIDALQPYIAKTNKILGIEPLPNDIPLDGTNGELKEVFFRMSRPPTNFKDAYLDFLRASDAVVICLNANLVDIKPETESGRVTSFAFRNYASDGPEFDATADQFVLALGGIENARMLLNANLKLGGVLGNKTDNVGRFFMEHLTFDAGFYTADSTKTHFGTKFRYVAPSPEFQRQAGIANCGLRVKPMKARDDEDFIASTKRAVKAGLCLNEAVADFVNSIKPFRCPAPYQ